MGVAGAVKIRIVQEDHVARADVPARQSGNPAGRGEPPPILAPAGPEERLQTGRPSGIEPGGTVDAVGRTVPEDSGPGRVLDDGGSAREVRHDLGG